MSNWIKVLDQDQNITWISPRFVAGAVEVPPTSNASATVAVYGYNGIATYLSMSLQDLVDAIVAWGISSPLIYGVDPLTGLPGFIIPNDLAFVKLIPPNLAFYCFFSDTPCLLRMTTDAFNAQVSSGSGLQLF